MNSSYDNFTAVVVLPAIGGRLRDAGLRRWLARADVVCAAQTGELLGRVLRAIGKPCPTAGQAALRFWGQTGDRPTVWIAAADPVYMEPRLDHLILHAMRRRDVQPAELRSLFDHLQSTLGGEGGGGAEIGFARVGSCGYVNSTQAMLTAALSACAIDQSEFADFLPSGEDANGHRQLSSEIEMALHEHATNIDRQERGLHPINGLWIWGGGYAPEKLTEPHPPLYADDPVLRGYWASKTGATASWPGSIAACLDGAAAGFVAVTPECDDDVDLLECCLNELRLAVKSRRLRRLILLFRDGVCADVRRSQVLRIWRRGDPLIDTSPEDRARDKQ